MLYGFHTQPRHVCKTRSRTRFLWRGMAFAFAVACLGSTSGTRAETMMIGGTGAGIGVMRVLAKAFEKRHPEVTITVPESMGSSGAIKGVLKGMLALGVTSRPLKDSERAKGIRQIPFARTPFGIATRHAAAATGLSTTDLIRIFSGKMREWPDGTRIRIFLRPLYDSDMVLLLEGIPGLGPALAKAHKTPGIPVAYTDQQAMTSAENTRGAITTASLSAILSEERHLTLVPIDGVGPTLENLANGSYRMSKTLSFIAWPKSGPLAWKFLDFVRSAEGGAIMREIGLLAIPAGRE